MGALVYLLACPACAAGDAGGGLFAALLLGGMILAPIGVAGVLIPSIVRIVRGRRPR